jgi:predicted lipid-binding transport protein (Tim44 family)
MGCAKLFGGLLGGLLGGAIIGLMFLLVVGWLVS